MKKTERDPLLDFKREADDTLFANLDFDARMKERVRQSLQEEAQPPARSKRRPFGRSRWAVGAMAAAAMISAILILSPDLGHDNLAHDPGQPYIGGSETYSPPEIDSGGNTPLVGGGTPGLTTGGGDMLYRVMTLAGQEEARDWFGDGLKVAEYVPETYALREIEALGSGEGRADQVSFRYTSGEQAYEVIQQRLAVPLLTTFGEAVEMGEGAEAYFAPTRTAAGSDETVRLIWYRDGILFTVTGPISREEALRIAQSMK